MVEEERGYSHNEPDHNLYKGGHCDYGAAEESDSFK